MYTSVYMTSFNAFFRLAPVLALFRALALPLFILLLWKRSVRAAAAFLVLVFLEGVIAAFYTVYTFGGAFGLGIMLFCSPFLSVPLSLLVLLLAYRPFSRAWTGGEAAPRRRFYLFGGLFILVWQLAPVVGYYGIGSACYAQNRRIGADLIAAVETYRQEQGRYPDSLEAIVPAYAPAIPAPGCAWLSGAGPWDRQGFELARCSSDVLLLTVESVDGSFIERYNFATGNWSSISFLDGACSFLR